MKQYSPYIFHDVPYEPKLPILFCSCPHANCNGRYVQVYEDQTTCLWTYWEHVDKSILIQNNHDTLSQLEVNIDLTQEIT